MLSSNDERRSPRARSERSRSTRSQRSLIELTANGSSVGFCTRSRRRVREMVAAFSRRRRTRHPIVFAPSRFRRARWDGDQIAFDNIREPATPRRDHEASGRSRPPPQRRRRAPHGRGRSARDAARTHAARPRHRLGRRQPPLRAPRLEPRPTSTGASREAPCSPFSWLGAALLHPVPPELLVQTLARDPELARGGDAALLVALERVLSTRTRSARRPGAGSRSSGSGSGGAPPRRRGESMRAVISVPVSA